MAAAPPQLRSAVATATTEPRPAAPLRPQLVSNPAASSSGGASGVGRSLAGLAAGIAAAGGARAAASTAGRTAARRGRMRRGRAARQAASSAAWRSGEQDARTFASAEEYRAHLERESILPLGFRVGKAALTFSPVESEHVSSAKMNITVIALDKPSQQYAMCFTSNAFPGCPVRVGKRRLAAGAPLQAVVVNNKVSNVCPGGDGEADSEAICAAVAAALDLPGGAASVLPASTGVIGWRLPVDEMVATMPAAVASLQAESALPGAEGIMTTDRYPKVVSAILPGGARIMAMAKGAGMIEPRMATMLCFILTDADLPCGRDELQSMLAKAVPASFNAISIDGDESTSDTVALLSSGKVPCTDVAAFEAALADVCRDMAHQLVRNGEGTEHVLRVAVAGASSDAAALRVGRAVVNGPLFKCAVSGNDPNVGRLVGKVGQALGAAGEAAYAEGAVFKIDGKTIFEKGKFTLDDRQEAELSAHLRQAQVDAELPYPPHFRVVDVEVELGGKGGEGQAVMLGSDLTKGYVECNADYRS